PPTCSDQALQRTLNLPLICAWDDACGLAGYGASMHAQAYDRARRYLSLPPLGWPHWASLLVALILSLVLGYAIFVRLTTPPPVSVQTAPVTRGTVVATVAGSGAVVADSASNVGFRTSGRVAEIYVQVGDQVQAGQQLARLDTQDLQAQLLQAQGALA